MGRHHATDDYEDDPNEPDFSDGDDDDEDESAETVACPSCGREVYEFAEQCPKCGEYLSDEDRPRSSYPRWVAVTTIVLLVLMAVAAVRWGI